MYAKVLNISRKPEMAKEFATEAAAPPGCIDALSGACGELARKYPWLGQFSPEAVAVGAILTWAGTAMALNAKLDKLERQILEARKVAEKAGVTLKQNEHAETAS